MEGRPWLRIWLILLGFTFLGLPVWRVTHPAAVAPPKDLREGTITFPLRVEVTFASPPTSFDLEYLGATLISSHAPNRDFAIDWKVAISKEGVDLFLSAEWPPGTPTTAVRVKVTRDGSAIAEQTFWGDGSLAETLTVWEPKP